MLLFRILDIFTLFPIRIKRLFLHFTQLFKQKPHHWLIEFCFLLLEIFGVFDLYDGFASLAKRARPLTEHEIGIARSIFGDSLAYERVRVDERAYWGPRKGNFCYVSCYTINSWGIMPDSILIHELTHVWQYQHLGSVYIPRALSAQFTAEGYNYGGVKALRAAMQNGKTLLDFNYEQQADIIEDYYRLLLGYRPSWGNATEDDLDIYAHFANQLHIK
ncbi:MAG: hypothetical protein ACK4TA_05140 [Saprospiraceae bacterium]